MSGIFFKTVAIQCLALILSGVSLRFFQIERPEILFFVIASAVAVVLARLLKAEFWWLIFHGIFPFGVFFANSIDISAKWYLTGLTILLGVFLPVIFYRIPLFLSSKETVRELITLCSDPGLRKPLKFLDCGCGTGRLILALARQAPEMQFVGVEMAPASYVMAKLRSIGVANLTIRYQDFWSLNFAEYTVIYAFLAPPPMYRLWKKFSEQSASGAVLISNTFAVKTIAPDRIETVNDRRKTLLYLYQSKKHSKEVT